MNSILILMQWLLDSVISVGAYHMFEADMFWKYALDTRVRRYMKHPDHTEPSTRDPRKKSKVSAEPSYGYEPYWQEGGGADLTGKKKQTGYGYACGERCHDLFIEYGKVCGRSQKYKHKTFDNYCKLLSYDCTGRDKWMVAYRGPCQFLDLKTYPTQRTKLIGRAEKYIKDFWKNNPTTPFIPLMTHYNFYNQKSKAEYGPPRPIF